MEQRLHADSAYYCGPFPNRRGKADVQAKPADSQKSDANSKLKLFFRSNESAILKYVGMQKMLEALA